MSVRLGELLLKANLISQDQLREALKIQKDKGVKLGEALINLGFVSEEDITECLSQQFGVPSINLAHFDIDPGVIKLIPADVARKYNILPVNKTGATITIAMADPTNVFAMDDIKFMTGYNVEPVVASETAVADAIANARLNDVLNARFYAGDIRLAMRELVEQAGRPDVAVVDPPRAGLSQKVVRRIVEAQPSRVVYISCNPTTLAPNAAQLRDAGWALRRVRPVDMFPQTPHIECVALLERADA